MIPILTQIARKLHWICSYTVFLGNEGRWQHRMLWILHDSFPGNLVQDKSERIWRLMAVAPWPGSLVMVQPGDYCPLPHTGVGAAQVFTQLHQPSPAQPSPAFTTLLPPPAPWPSIHINLMTKIQPQLTSAGLCGYRTGEYCRDSGTRMTLSKGSLE